MFFDPTSRLYWPLLLSALIVGFLYSKKSFSLSTVKRYLLHPSTYLDVGLLMTNSLLKLTVFSLMVGSAASMAMPIVDLLITLEAPKLNLDLSNFSLKLLLTLFVFITSDFLRFLQHRLMHHFAWSIHKVHHSAPLLTPLTLFRTHPLEAFVSYSRAIFTHALTIIFMVYFLSGKLSSIDFLGVNLLGFIFNAALANLRHSPIPISFGILEYFFISPRMHQIHHSKDPLHLNKNFGVALSLWDQLSGSFYRPTAKECEELTFGILESEPAPLPTLKAQRAF